MFVHKEVTLNSCVDIACRVFHDALNAFSESHRTVENFEIHKGDHWVSGLIWSDSYSFKARWIKIKNICSTFLKMRVKSHENRLMYKSFFFLNVTFLNDI